MIQIVEVEDVRLASGYEPGEATGDIYASLSLDIIPSLKVRRPFSFNGSLMVATSVEYPQQKKHVKAYALVPRDSFDGEALTYGDKISADAGKSARADPNGFYHGMIVRHKKTDMVLCGPPVFFIARPTPKQLDLF